MIDSLTVSILLFVALAIGAVVALDAWRAWRLRRLSVKNETPKHVSRPVDPEPRGPISGGGTLGTSSAGTTRGEPSLGLAGVQPDDPVRVEPQLGSLEGAAYVTADSAQERPRDGGPASLVIDDAGASPVIAADRTDAGRLTGSAPSPFEYVDSRPVFTAQPKGQSERSGEIGSSAGPRVADDTGGDGRMDSSPMQHLHEGLSPAVAKPPGSIPPDVSSATSGSLLSSEPRGGVLSDRTDCVALLRFVQPVTAEKLVSLGQSFRRSGSKPVMLEVLAAAAMAEGWHSPRAGELCAAARFGLLLANRAGPLNALEYTDFAQRVRELAASLGVGVEISDMASVLARARALDSDSARLDAQVCINVDAAETLGPAQLAALAGPLAIVERGNNRYARLGPRGETIFSVSLGEQPNRLSFLLDVPRVPIEARPFAAMIECVRISARRLPGRIIDDGGKALSDRGIEAIMSQLDERCAALTAADLAPGSAPALRVFN